MTAITIRDVADRAEVSFKTVSRVLNDEPNVRAELRQRVRAAADALGYQPNVSARQLRGSSSQLIIALVDAPLTLDHLRSEHGAHFLNRFQLGVMLKCREAGYHLMVELVDIAAEDARQKVQKLLRALKPDGMILTPPISDDLDMLDMLDAMQTPFVRFGPDLDVERGHRVYMDDFQAARRMTDYLIEMGHQDIGFIIGSPRYPAARLRLGGFRAAMQAHGLDVGADRLQQGDFTFVSGLRCAEALLRIEARPTAIFASNDEMALGVMHAAAELGLSTPGDLSIVGFDDIGSAHFSIPPLTTIRQPVMEMSSEAADMLTRRPGPVRVEGRSAAPSPFELVVRNSAAAPRHTHSQAPKPRRSTARTAKPPSAPRPAAKPNSGP